MPRSSSTRPGHDALAAYPDYHLDVSSMGRRAGSMLDFDKTVPALDGVGNPMVNIPADSTIHLSGTAEGVIEGIWMRVLAEAEIIGECSRCLSPIGHRISARAEDLCVYGEAPRSHRSRPSGQSGSSEPAESGDESLWCVVDDRVNLEPCVRDALALAIPLSPLCDSDCPGLCSECGVRLADEPDHRHDSTDPRWAGLAGLLDPDTRATAE